MTLSCLLRRISRRSLVAASTLAIAAASHASQGAIELPVESCHLEATLRVEPQSRPVSIANDDELILSVSGVYCSGTAPQLESIEVENGTIRLLATATGDILSGNTQTFGFTSTLEPLEAGLWTVELWIEDPGVSPSPFPVATLSFGVLFSCFGLEQLEVSSTSPLAPLTVSASGGWCQGSPPELQRVEVDGDTVRLLSVATSEGPAVVSSWSFQTQIDPLPPGDYTVELVVHDLVREGPQVAASRNFTVGTLCSSQEGSLCLNRGRFEVEATWRTGQGESGPGTPIPVTADSGLFWFFEPDNVELDVKVLDACDLAGFESFWVFVAGLTDVGVDITVTDRHSGEVWTRSTPIGAPFQPILDTSAFDTCP